jgi:hypothetical protein
MKKVCRAACTIIGLVILLLLAGAVFLKFFGESVFRSQVIANLPFDVRIGALEYQFPGTFEARDLVVEDQALIRRARFIMSRPDFLGFARSWFTRDRVIVVSGRLVIEGAEALWPKGPAEPPGPGEGWWRESRLELDARLAIDRGEKRATRLSYEGRLELPGAGPEDPRAGVAGGAGREPQ